MEKLFEGNLYKKFFVFSLPLIFSAILSQSNNVIDSAMVGRFIGSHAFAAASATSDFNQLIQSMFWGYSLGASIYVALLFGKSDYRKMFNVIKVNLLLTTLIAVLFVVAMITGYRTIFDVLKVPDEIYNDARIYYFAASVQLIFININTFFVPVYNAINRNKVAVVVSTVNCVLNILGKYIVLKIFGLGIPGAAVIGILTSLMATVIYTIYFVATLKKFNIKLFDMYLSAGELKKSATYGFPVMLQQSVMFVCNAIISPLKNSCGAAALSGLSVGTKVFAICNNIYGNSNKVVSNYIAQCVGAGKFRLIKKGIKVGAIQTALFTLPVLTLLVLFADKLPMVFLDKTSSPETIHYAFVYIRYVQPFAAFHAVNSLFHQIFRGAGASRYLVMSTAVYSVSNILFSYFLFQSYGMYGIYAGMVIAWLCETIFGAIVYFSGKWKPEAN